MTTALVSLFLVFSLGEGRDGASATRPSSTQAVAIEQAANLAGEGWQLFQKQKYAEAADKFEEAVKLDAESTSAWNGLGWSRFNSGDPWEAEKAFMQCMKLDESHGAAMNGLGQVYFALKDFDKVEKYLLGAVKQGATAPYYTLARLYLIKHRYEDAAKWAEKYLSQQPKDELARKMLQAAKARKLTPELLKQIQPPVLKKTPAAAEIARGWTMFQRGESKRAVPLFRKALAMDPNAANAWNGLGWALFSSAGGDDAQKAKQIEEAVEAFHKALKLEPNSAGAVNGLARCLKTQGKTQEAIDVWLEGVKDVPSMPGGDALRWGLAETYLETGNYAEAAKFYEELVKVAPNEPRAKQGLEAARAHLTKQN